VFGFFFHGFFWLEFCFRHVAQHYRIKSYKPGAQFVLARGLTMRFSLVLSMINDLILTNLGIFALCWGIFLVFLKL
tara:strand:- start:3000 stop:3227 length:228 start_codon:yes stop_codon:yes gene_type:complete